MGHQCLLLELEFLVERGKICVNVLNEIGEGSLDYIAGNFGVNVMGLILINSVVVFVSFWHNVNVSVFDRSWEKHGAVIFLVVEDDFGTDRFSELVNMSKYLRHVHIVS